MATGRYAPSPTGDLHVGNLRTALLAWLFAHFEGDDLRLRIDDLDPNATSRAHEHRQLADLAAIGIEFSGEVLRQSQRFDHYQQAIDQLIAAGFTYPCFCSRREVREAASAPHVHLPQGAYPGTCRHLSDGERERRSLERPAALRVRADNARISYRDRVHGDVTIEVDDFVVRRNDGVPSYNLATVLDDEAQGVGEVVRGADLLEGTARQIWLRERFGLSDVSHAHVPLMVNTDGERLAKRDGAVTLADLSALGWSPAHVRGLLAQSIGLSRPGDVPTMRELVDRFDPSLLTTSPTVWTDPPRKQSQNTSSDIV